MNPRVRPFLVATAVAGILALSGCGLLAPAGNSAAEGRTAGTPVLATPSPEPTSELDENDSVVLSAREDSA